MKNLKALFVLISFILTNLTPPDGWAQVLGSKSNTSFITAIGLMPKPGSPVSLSVGFDLAHFKGMVIDQNDPFKFDFIIHQGDQRLSINQKNLEYSKLIKYFLAALAVPDTDQWVNLSPYEKNRIIAKDFGLTAMGRDLLAQDYLLKQLSSSLTDPGTGLGQKFWDQVYERVYREFGTKEVPVNTFNKVWIVPDRAVIYEKGNMMYVIESHLKVMTEADYLAMKKHQQNQILGNKGTATDISNQIMRQVIIPSIEKEVNTGKNFAPLRQVFSGMLLATWYKRVLRQSILTKLYADKNKLKGVDQDPRTNEKIYQEYLKAYKKGVYNLIKEETDPVTQEVIPRKYFAGGVLQGYGQNYSMIVRQGTPAQFQNDVISESSDMSIVRTRLNRFTTQLKAYAARIAAPVLKVLRTTALPGAVTAGTLMAHASTVKLAWDPSISNNVVGYNLVYGTDPNQLTNSVNAGNVTNAVINGLSPGTLYYFAANAYDGAGNTSPNCTAISYMTPSGVNAGSGPASIYFTPGATVTYSISNPNAISNIVINNIAGTFTYTPVNNTGSALTVTVTLTVNGVVQPAETIFVAPPFSLAFSSFGTEQRTNRSGIVRNYPVLDITATNNLPNVGYVVNVYSSTTLTPFAPTGSTWNVIGTFNVNPSTNLTQQIADPLTSDNTPSRYYNAVALPSNQAQVTSSTKSNRAGQTIVPIKFSTRIIRFSPPIVITSKNTRLRFHPVDKATLRRQQAAANAGRAAAVDASMAKGGIDFAQSNLDMQIRRDGKGIVLPVSQQNLDNIHIDGLVPVILGILPVDSALLIGRNVEANALVSTS